MLKRNRCSLCRKPLSRRRFDSLKRRAFGAEGEDAPAGIESAHAVQEPLLRFGGAFLSQMLRVRPSTRGEGVSGLERDDAPSPCSCVISRARHRRQPS